MEAEEDPKFWVQNTFWVQMRIFVGSGYQNESYPYPV